MTVRVYRNLNASAPEERWSIIAWDHGEPDYGRVVDRAERLALTDVSFKVQPAGVNKAQETNVKNVHAYAEGELSDDVRGGGEPATYTHERGQFFLIETGHRILRAPHVDFTENGMFVHEPVKYLTALGVEYQ